MKIEDFKLKHISIEVWNDKPDFPVIELEQVHGTILVNPDELLAKADGYLINSPLKKPLAIKTADCLPLLIYSKTNKSLAFIHAGWRGLAKGIHTQEQIKKLNPEHVFMGPYIHQKNYEVSQEFTKNFPGLDAFKEINGRLLCDLGKIASSQLKSVFPNIQIIDTGIDTYAHKSLNSFRQNSTNLRNWNILTIDSLFWS